MPFDVTAPKLLDHFFRHEYGRLVALLTQRFGLRHIDLAEDTVQSALVEALHTWKTRGVPEEPAGWIYRVASNRMLDEFRRRGTAERMGQAMAVERLHLGMQGPDAQKDAHLDSEIEDSQLRLIFACGHPVLPTESRIALTLKTLCGFSTTEVARALLISEENAKKRITRAKQQLIDEAIPLEVPAAELLAERLDTVHSVLYLLFNEGYSATSAEQAIRAELCSDAARLCHLLTLHPRCSTAGTFALLALMLFHAARLDARLDQDGCLLLLEEQDRGRWDYHLIKRATDYLARSAGGNTITCYHLEAGIAMYHCKARSFVDTDWPTILRHYDLLLQLQQSPVYRLNRAIALAHVEGPVAGIQAIEEIRAHPQLREYHLLDATLGELHRRAGNFAEARLHFGSARQKARSPQDRQLLERRLAMCSGQP